MKEVKDGKRGSGYSAIRRLGDGQSDWDARKEFKIPAYCEKGLTANEAANKLADHFSAISQTVKPLDILKLHPSLRLAVKEGQEDKSKPILSQHDVYRKLMSIKKPNSSVDGDIPKKLVKQHPYLWAGPATKVFNNIIQRSEWPTPWKIENAIPLHKTGCPQRPKNPKSSRWHSKIMKNA